MLFRTVPSANTLVRWVNENAFAFIVQARPCPTFGRPVHLRGSPHRLRPGTSPHALRIPPRDGHPALRGLPGPASGPPWLVSGFRLRARLGFSIPVSPPGPRGITPAFGYGTPHSSARGTSTLLSNALLSAPYGPLRLPDWPPPFLATFGAATPANPEPPSLTQIAFSACRAHYPGGSDGCFSVHHWRAPAPGFFPNHSGLPVHNGRSASTVFVSRPARASLVLRPADLLTHLLWAWLRGFDEIRYQTPSLVSYPGIPRTPGLGLSPTGDSRRKGARCVAKILKPV